MMRKVGRNKLNKLSGFKYQRTAAGKTAIKFDTITILPGQLIESNQSKNTIFAQILAG
jgi:hypothetical protein